MTQTTLSIDTLTYRDVAKTIDHSLLRPELDDAFVEAGCRLALAYDVASVCVRPADVVRARKILDGTSVAIGTTIGFPHGNHLTVTKVFESVRAIGDGARELDMVIQIGALKSGRDADVEADIRAVVDVAHAAGAIVKVIFENAYLTDDEKVRACHLTEAAGGDFVKTSTGFAPTGATHEDLRAHAPLRLAAHRGQGGRRRPDARRADRRHGPGRHPGRRDGDGDDPRRLQGAQGRARRRLRAGDHRRGRLLDGRRGPPRDARVRLHRGPLPVRPPVRAGRPGRGERRRRAAPGPRPSRPRHGIERTYDTMAGLCGDPEVDLVVIALPNHLHLEAVRAATAAGKGVLCTKPLGRNAAEAAEMLRLVQRRGRLPRLHGERSLQPGGHQGRRDGRVGRARTGPHDARA